MEKFVAEFGVEKTVERDYGYAEKYLTYNEDTIPYKAILKNGEFIAIVSRKYCLLENEKVVDACKEVSKEIGFEIDVFKTKTRVHVLLEKKDKGVVVHNSIDGSYAFRVDLLTKIDGTKVVFHPKVLNLRTIEAKHLSGLASISERLKELIISMLENVEKARLFVKNLKKYNVADHLDSLKMIEGIIPKKYFDKPLKTADTLYEFYTMTATRIWMGSTDFRRKADLFRKLNEAMIAITGW
jgi:hypothetical protein